MTNEKWLSLAWVAVLVPIVLTIFNAIKIAGFQEGGYLLLRVFLCMFLILILVGVPQVFKKYLNKAGDTVSELKKGVVLFFILSLPIVCDLIAIHRFL